MKEATPDFPLLHQQRLVLEARATESRRSYDSLRAQVSHHQARVHWQPQVREVLELLQRREHERSVGAYEQMLSALLQDVLPGNRQAVLELYQHNGTPALDIQQSKDGSPPEDIMSGAGGSVANILSAGLRAIALIRSGKRRFLILDEADCWIKPLWAPRFAEVIQQLAVQLGVQILMISHHEESLLSMIPHRLRIEKTADGLSAQWSPTSDIPVWEENAEGIRSITLEDFQSHTFTHLSLSPGVTLLSGDNDIGKSSVVAALRGIFLNESNDTFIQHGKKSARVSIDFGPQHFLTWERFLKGKVKESLRHFRAEEGPEKAIHASDGAKALPDWLEPTFGIGLIDGIDVQLCHQKEPLFLLNKTNTMRARALAIGREAGHVQTMIALDKREISESRAVVKQGEKSLERLSRSLLALRPMEASRGAWEKLSQHRDELEKHREELRTTEALYARWKAAFLRKRALEALVGKTLENPPQLQCQESMLALESRWQRATQKLKATEPLTASFPASAPSLQATPFVVLQQRWAKSSRTSKALSKLETQAFPVGFQREFSPEMAGMAQRWSRAQRKLQALAPLLNQSLPQAPSTVGAATELIPIGHRWSQAVAQQDQAQIQLKQVSAQQEELAQHEATCPECGQSWSPGS